jgi:3-hydroxyisobutyrate dehydrogenase-like beta-hydroxyacid dehydrogenase
MEKRLGFIGLGSMGSRMAARLLDAGYHLTVYNRTPERAQQLVEKGATSVAGVGELMEQSDFILLSLSDDEAVAKVANDSLARAAKGKVFIDLSTVLPATSIQMAKNAQAAGATWLDAAVSGSTPQAEAGELVIMVGGEQPIFKQSEPILSHLGHKIYYMGPSGSGAKTKLSVNILLGLGVQAIAEALVLGQRMGLDKSRLIEVLSESVVVSPSQKIKLANAQADDYRAAFPLRLMYKDLGLIMAEAGATSTPLPAVAAARQIAAIGMAKELNDEDFSVVIRLMEELVKP